jgi:protein-S-isoprenylcysteine O-methyltransferase Ste14
MNEFGDGEMAGRQSRGGAAKAAGLVILVAAAIVYATGWLDSIVSLLVLALGVVVGIALLYLGVSQKRDAEAEGGEEEGETW